METELVDVLIKISETLILGLVAITFELFAILLILWGTRK